jgi:hypothetical protein
MVCAMSEFSEGAPLGKSMTHWVLELQRLGLRKVAGEVDQDKLEELRQLDSLGCPHYQRHVATVETFLGEPAVSFRQLNREQYFVILSPRNDQLERFRERNLSQLLIPEFIHSNVTREQWGDYDVILEETYPHCYGGNIVCRKDGSIDVEMIAGELGHNQLVSGATPEFILRRDRVATMFNYRSRANDLLAKQVLWEALLSIPHQGAQATDSTLPDYSQAVFPEGYFEFYIDQRQPSLPLQPVFIGYSDKAAFLG